ncbi:flagellar basal body-associated FliL family protein [Imhoffiella purpurea]|uniref:Flagellar protein FliL n=1 Tax=Imhoffiella purpurea TaxID=1249627 RepID=W9VJ91_9GAMM|nr:flagellar basal body-associated FliL family protein [Imhoffiella purpurea]EXJ16127.1 Flagellar biosynthesis protein FliL [Imhoffiella purpurea]
MRFTDRRLHILPIILLCLLPMLGHASGDDAPKTYPGYIELKPAIIVNLASTRRSQYLKIDIQCLVETAEEAELLEHNMPLVRDRLISLLGGRSADQMQTTQQRDDLRAELLADLRDSLLRTTGRGVISAIYFTGFIIQ